MVKYLVIVQICEALRTVLLQTHQNCPYIHDKLNQNSLAHLPYSMLPYKSFNTNRMSCSIRSGTQTWQWKRDHLSVIFLLKPPFSSGIFRPAMFDYQRVFHVICSWYSTPIECHIQYHE